MRWWGLTVATQSKGYKGEISFTMERADQDRSIRVTLMENGQEVEQYSAVYPAGAERQRDHAPQLRLPAAVRPAGSMWMGSSIWSSP